MLWPVIQSDQERAERKSFKSPELEDGDDAIGQDVLVLEGRHQRAVAEELDVIVVHRMRATAYSISQVGDSSEQVGGRTQQTSSADGAVIVEPQVEVLAKRERVGSASPTVINRKQVVIAHLSVIGIIGVTTLLQRLQCDHINIRSLYCLQTVSRCCQEWSTCSPSQ